LRPDTRISGNEGRVEGALCEDRAKMIWQPERNKECVGNGTRPDHCREHDVAEKTGEAGGESIAAYRENLADHRELFTPPLLPAKSEARARGSLMAASVQIAAHGIDDPILHRRLKIGVHRQTEYLVSQPVAHRHATIGYREGLVSRLAMQRL